MRIKFLWLLAAVTIGFIFNQKYSLSLNEQTPSLSVDETFFYAPRSRQFLDNKNFADVAIWEHRQDRSLYLGEIIPTVLLAGIKNNFSRADILFPALSFLAIGWLIFQLTKNHYLSMFGSTLTIGFFHYLNYFPYLPSILTKIWLALSQGSYSLLMRTPHPQLTLGLWAIFGGLVWLRLNKRLSAVWLGLGLAVLTYSHFFYWTFGLVWILILGNFTSILIWFLLTIPYFINQWQLINLSVWPEFMARINLPSALNINQVNLMVAGFLLILLIKQPKLKRFWTTFYLSADLIVVVSTLCHLGVDDPVGHWFTRIIEPMTIIMFISLLADRIKKMPNWLLMGLSYLILIYLGLTQQIYFNKNKAGLQIETTKTEAFNWLNSNTPKDSVVVTASLKDNIYLAAYTHNNTYISKSQNSLATIEEQIIRFMSIYRTAGIEAVRVNEMFSLTEANKKLRLEKRFNFDDCGGTFFYFRKFVANDYYNCSIPAKELTKLIKQYNNFESNLKQYRTDYWLWGPYEKQWAKIYPKTIANWQKLWENQDYIIYKIND